MIRLDQRPRSKAGGPSQYTADQTREPASTPRGCDDDLLTGYINDAGDGSNDPCHYDIRYRIAFHLTGIEVRLLRQS